jgi:hypothetical protein
LRSHVNNNDTAKNVHRAKLLDRRAIPLTPGDIPVRADVFIHNLDAFTLEALRRAVTQGLTPSGLDFTGDDDSIAILRFTRARAGEAEEREAPLAAQGESFEHGTEGLLTKRSVRKWIKPSVYGGAR